MSAELEKMAPNMRANERLEGVELRLKTTEKDFESARRSAKRAREDFEEVKEKRRKEDEPEAKKSARDALEHWKGFFGKNDKYKVVGTVIHDSDKPDPPAPCEAAMKKRPIKGGVMADLLKRSGAVDGKIAGGAAKKPAAMPDFVKNAAKKKNAAAEAKLGQPDDDDEDLIRDEL